MERGCKKGKIQNIYVLFSSSSSSFYIYIWNIKKITIENFTDGDLDKRFQTGNDKWDAISM